MQQFSMARITSEQTKMLGARQLDGRNADATRSLRDDARRRRIVKCREGKAACFPPCRRAPHSRAGAIAESPSRRSHHPPGHRNSLATSRGGGTYATLVVGQHGAARRRQFICQQRND